MTNSTVVAPLADLKTNEKLFTEAERCVLWTILDTAQRNPDLFGGSGLIKSTIQRLMTKLGPPPVERTPRTPTVHFLVIYSPWLDKPLLEKQFDNLADATSARITTANKPLWRNRENKKICEERMLVEIKIFSAPNRDYLVEHHGKYFRKSPPNCIFPSQEN